MGGDMMTDGYNGELHGIKLYRYDVTDSTNTRAKEYHRAHGRGEPVIFVAGAQTAGRGTRGRSFESPESKGLYMSLLFYPDINAADAGSITTYAAVCVHKAISEYAPTDVRVGIKWVNDVYIENKKVAGILTEGEAQPDGRLAYAIIGIGINLYSGGLSDSVSSVAASLADFDISVGYETFLSRLTEILLDSLTTLGAGERMDEYRRRSMLIGREVTVITAEREEIIRVTDIGDKGELIGRDRDGRLRSYLSADTHLLTFGDPCKENN